MKILIVVRGKYPTPEASSKRLTNYLEALKIEQHNVEILPVYINYTSNYQDLLYSFFIPILALGKVFIKAGATSAVFVYGFGWVGKLCILVACKLRRRPIVIEVNEKPYSINGGNKRDYFLDPFKNFHKFCLERLVYSRIDGFLVISEALLNFIDLYRKKNSIICKVPILVDFAYYQRDVAKPDAYSPFIINSARLNDHKDGIVKVFKAFAKVVNEKGFDLYFYLTSKVAPSDITFKVK